MWFYGRERIGFWFPSARSPPYPRRHLLLNMSIYVCDARLGRPPGPPGTHPVDSRTLNLRIHVKLPSTDAGGGGGSGSEADQPSYRRMRVCQFPRSGTRETSDYHLLTTNYQQSESCGLAPRFGPVYRALMPQEEANLARMSAAWC
jgi:hypothetical protein